MIPMPRLIPNEEQDVDRLVETGEGEGELSRLLLDLRATAPVAPAADLSGRVLTTLAAERKAARVRLHVLAAAAALVLAVGIPFLLPRPTGPEPTVVAATVDPARAALDWIVSAQEPDGRWNPLRWGGAAGQDAGITALATWALLRGGRAEHSDALEKGLAWLAGPGLRRALLRDGHDSALTGIVLLEAARTGRPQMREPVAFLAAQFSARFMANEGYLASPGRGPTESEVWSAMFVRHAQDAGLISARVARPALARLCACDSTATLPASPAAAYCQATAARTMAPQQVTGALPVLLASSPKDYVSTYFLSALSAGTVLQDEVAQGLRHAILGRQVGAGELKGSFAPSGKWSSAGGTVMATSLAALTLLEDRKG